MNYSNNPKDEYYKGIRDAIGEMICPRCWGNGYIWIQEGMFDDHPIKHVCPMCNGSRKVCYE